MHIIVIVGRHHVAHGSVMPAKVNGHVRDILSMFEKVSLQSVLNYVDPGRALQILRVAPTVDYVHTHAHKNVLSPLTRVHICREGLQEVETCIFPKQCLRCGGYHGASQEGGWLIEPASMSLSLSLSLSLYLAMRHWKKRSWSHEVRRKSVCANLRRACLYEKPCVKTCCEMDIMRNPPCETVDRH